MCVRANVVTRHAISGKHCRYSHSNGKQYGNRLYQHPHGKFTSKSITNGNGCGKQHCHLCRSYSNFNRWWSQYLYLDIRSGDITIHSQHHRNIYSNRNQYGNWLYQHPHGKFISKSITNGNGSFERHSHLCWRHGYLNGRRRQYLYLDLRSGDSAIHGKLTRHLHGNRNQYVNRLYQYPNSKHHCKSIANHNCGSK